MKRSMGIPRDKPLADHLPAITIKAKDLATEMSTYKTQDKNLHGIDQIKQEHIDNNASVRRMLNENGIYPERLPAL
jgi:DNA-damage-inducible protein D